MHSSSELSAARHNSFIEGVVYAGLHIYLLISVLLICSYVQYLTTVLMYFHFNPLEPCVSSYGHTSNVQRHRPERQSA